MHGARATVLAILATVATGCGSAPEATRDPGVLPSGYAVVWDITGSTATDGRGSYFDGPTAPHLVAGTVLVAWACSGSGGLTVIPAHVDDHELPSPSSPLAFQVTCPTTTATFVGWRTLELPAAGGENILNIRPVASPSANISYRVMVAQQRP